MTNLNRSDDNNLLVALRHPLRRQLLRRMIGAAEAISPTELATELDQPLSSVAYHMRILADNGAVSLVKTRPVRGSVQHFYRAAVEAAWAHQILGLSEGEDGATGESRGRPET